MRVAAKPIIVLFRQDLRVQDNPTFYHACQTGQPIIPLYILDDITPGKWKMGEASRWWLHQSLISLNQSLQKFGSKLYFAQGETLEVLTELAKKYGVEAIYFNRCYEPYNIKLQKKIKQHFPSSESFNGSLLFEPWEVLNKQHQPFKIFTPFWKRCTELLAFEEPLPVPKHILTKKIELGSVESIKLKTIFNFENHWQAGEDNGLKKLNHFIKHSLTDYETARDVPSLDGTSSLSPHLHFGEVGPRQIFYALKNIPRSEKFLSEIGWREFSNYQLYHFPQLPDQPWQEEFAKFPWEKNAVALKKWQQGETGYPIVDAGMRQLLATGWLHNRVRMIVASFLIKDLFISWQEGERWFWERLVDADLANNSASWQWVAGCGFDAAPFFRIFNPILQGKKFDPDGTYIRRWIPELSQLPNRYIHTPWEYNEAKLSYPKPIVNHAEARKKALASFKKIKKHY